MTYSLLGNHLLGGVDVKAATRTPFTFGRLDARLGFAVERNTFPLDNGGKL